MIKVLDLFSGIGGISRGLEATGGFETVAFCEIDPFCREVLKKHFPNVPIYEDIKSLHYDDSFPKIDMVCGGFPCFVKGTLIETSEGFVPIEDISVGDSVRTHNNRFCKVSSVMSRTSPIIEVKVYGSCPIQTTSEHPFLVRKRVDKQPHRGKTKHLFSDPMWINASELDKDCYVAMPLDTPKLTSDKTLDFWYLVGRYIGDGWIVNHKRSSKIPQGKRGSRVNSRVWKVIICTNNEDAHNLKEKISLAGFHSTTAVERSVTKFHICSKELVLFLGQFGKYAHGKKLPRFIFEMSDDVQRAIFQGWIDSDGHEEKESIHGATVSKNLAIGMARISRNVFSKYTSISLTNISSTTCVIENRIVNHRPIYSVNVWKNSKKICIWEDNVCWMPINKVSSLNTTDTVYNISVQDDESYVADGCIVHNCQSVSCAGKQRGEKDDRWLWPEFYRIVCEFKPEWVLVENVPGLLTAKNKEGIKGGLFGGILRDFSEIGYDVQWQVLSARQFGALHLRKRVFLVAHSNK